MQDFALVSDYTVFQNVEIPLLYGTAMKAAERKRRILEALERVGLQHKQNAYAATLSGGEKQRIGIARAFLHDAEFIFLDEPTSNIDSLNEGMILRSLEQEKQGKTVLLVSHRRSTMGICDDVTAMG